MSNRTENKSNNNVHPICVNSSDPDKCALFVERLTGISSNLEITAGLAVQMEADRRSKDI